MPKKQKLCEGMAKNKQCKDWKYATNRVAYYIINVAKLLNARKRQNFTDSAKTGSSTSLTSTESGSNVY